MKEPVKQCALYLVFTYVSNVGLNKVHVSFCIEITAKKISSLQSGINEVL